MINVLKNKFVIQMTGHVVSASHIAFESGILVSNLIFFHSRLKSSSPIFVAGNVFVIDCEPPFDTIARPDTIIISPNYPDYYKPSKEAYPPDLYEKTYFVNDVNEPIKFCYDNIISTIAEFKYRLENPYLHTS